VELQFVGWKINSSVYRIKNQDMKILLLMIGWWMLPGSIYTLQFTDIDGNSISMSQFQGKKILFVNIATGSTRTGQLGELQQLHEQYADRVVIIGFPSNSFGHEARSNAEIKQFCTTTYNTSFLFAQKISVKGESVHPIYNWLTLISENEMMDQQMGSDFQKFLVDETGKLIGVFSPSVNPGDPKFIQEILNTNQ
jgi:glutathione peroxidase